MMKPVVCQYSNDLLIRMENLELSFDLHLKKKSENAKVSKAIGHIYLFSSSFQVEA